MPAEASVGAQRSPTSIVDPQRFDRVAGTCSIVLAAGGLVYSAAFVMSLRIDARAPDYVAALLLTLSGLVSSLVWKAIYERLRDAGPPIALWAFALGLLSAAGAMVHGGYDLANLFNPPSRVPDLPNAIDPRGMLTFGVAAASLAVASWLIVASDARLPRRLGQLGYVAAALLLVVYLGRLILLDPENPFLLGSAALLGVVVLPWWYVWLGITLRRGSS
jgi:hypothetical protein